MKKFWAWLKGLDAGTIVRTLLQAMAYVNQFIAIIGASSFAAAEWYQWLSLGATFITTVLSWWYNNDFTSAAKWGTKVLNALADGVITEEEVKELLDAHKEQ